MCIHIITLLTLDAGILIDESHAYSAPTAAEREAFLAAQEASLNEQKERYRTQQEEHRRQIEEKLASERGADGMTALERRRARQAKKGAAAENDVPPRAEQTGAETDDVPYVHYTLGASDTLPGYSVRIADGEVPSDSPNAFTTLEAAYAAGVWTYPSTLRERAKCAVFEHLHAQGYYLSTGLRFGGDFVVYPGDPLRYHSHFTAQVLSTPSERIPAFQIVASGRLGTAVKKSHLLCQANTTTVDDDEARQRRRTGADEDSAVPWGKVECWSLAWAGFGT